MHPSTPTENDPQFDNGMIRIPELIPIFPLREVVLLPGEVLPLHIFEPRYRAMVRDALAGHRVIGMIEIADDRERLPDGPAPIRPLGCAGFIADYTELPDGRFLLWLLGLERFAIAEELDVSTPYRQARVTFSPVRQDPSETAGLQPIRRELRQLLPRLVVLDDEDRETLIAQVEEITDSQLIALTSQILELPARRKRQLLEADTQIDRFMLLYESLYRHLDGHPEVEEPDATVLN